MVVSRSFRRALLIALAVPVLLGWVAASRPQGAFGEDKPSGKKSSAKSKPVAAAEDEEPADDALDVEDEVMSVLVPPAELLGTVRTTDRLRFTQSLRGLLLEGVTADGAAAAKRHYEAAHQASANDPRAAYAYGIALLEQQNPKEALEQFRASVRHAKGAFLPGLQAVAWVQIERHENAPALATLADLARRLEDSKGNWPAEHDRSRSAEWLGRVAGFLAGPGSSADDAKQVEQAIAEIEKGLTGDRKAAFERGRAVIPKRQKELQAQAARPVDEVIAEADAKRKSAKEASQAADAEVKRIEEEIRDIRKPFEQQISEAKTELRTNATKARNMSREIPEVEEAVEELSVARKYPTGVRSRRGVVSGINTRNENAQEKKTRETQLASARQRLQQLQSSVDNAKQSMVDARKQSEKAQVDMRSAIAAKQPELREAKRKAQELAAKVKDLEHAKLTPERLKALPTLLEGYVHLDPEIEKNRLLGTLKSSGSH